MLKHYGVVPVLVFDGRTPKVKDDEVQRRVDRMAEDKTKGLMLLDKINHTPTDKDTSKLKSEAESHFQRCIRVTPEMKQELILLLKKMKIQYIVSPYESDAQMTYLCKINYTQGIITEDSDLIVYSAVINKSYPIITKLTDNGEVVEYTLQSILNGNKTDKFWKQMKVMTNTMFIQGCIMSGCDYLKSIDGIGTNKAFKLLQKYHMYNDDERMKHIILELQRQRKKNIPEGYVNDFEKSYNAFFTHKVCDPFKNEIVSLVYDNNKDVEITADIEDDKDEDGDIKIDTNIGNTSSSSSSSSSPSSTSTATSIASTSSNKSDGNSKENGMFNPFSNKPIKSSSSFTIRASPITIQSNTKQQSSSSLNTNMKVTTPKMTVFDNFNSIKSKYQHLADKEKVNISSSSNNNTPLKTPNLFSPIDIKSLSYFNQIKKSYSISNPNSLFNNLLMRKAMTSPLKVSNCTGSVKRTMGTAKCILKRAYNYLLLYYDRKTVPDTSFNNLNKNSLF